MTRRDFERLADALAGLRPEEEDGDAFAAWASVVREVGTVCYSANGNFDRGRFERACRTRFAPEGAPMG